MCEASRVEPSRGSWRRTVGRRCLEWKSKEVPLTSDVLDPEREREEREPEPEQPETVPEDEPGITAPEPEILPDDGGLQPKPGFRHRQASLKPPSRCLALGRRVAADY